MKTKKIIPLLLLPLVIFSGCNGQTRKGSDQILTDKNKGLAVTADTLTKPEVKIKVNKQYDDRGNIVKYDSTYSYFYSSPGGKILESSNDSVFNKFRNFFNTNYPDFLNPQYNSIFYNDSLFKYDFFNGDYFQKRFEMNRAIFDKIYKQMDSLKLDYLQHNYPNGHQKKKSP